MKAYLINTHLLVPRSRSSAKVKVKYQGNFSQKMGVSRALVFHKHILFFQSYRNLEKKTIVLRMVGEYGSSLGSQLQLLLAYPITTQYCILTHWRYIAVQKIVRKGEIACNKQFLLFSQCFVTYMVLTFHLKCTVKCCLQFLSIWTSLKFCHLVVR